VSTQSSIIYMANQIARNLAVNGDDAAVEAMIAHITAFWDPRMRSMIITSPADGLDPIAARAVDALRLASV
jgi:formate dehydrogenase subunit delta